ncbi:VOC family protein [Bdellovibrio bacteriovorus]|uniref:VOC family protein n=1 Tax=Bdellovibrio bacteriovorus TaxID=959 RepID=UPI0035A92B53
MARQIYVNLPVKDLKKSMGFFSQLGFEFNPEFTNDQGACMIIGENIYAMLLDEEFFKTFIDKPVCDAKKSTEVLVCFSADTRKDVDTYVAKAQKAGGTVPRKSQDHGFMYQHSFEDLDGHIWEIVSYEPAK